MILLYSNLYIFTRIYLRIFFRKLFNHQSEEKLQRVLANILKGLWVISPLQTPYFFFNQLFLNLIIYVMYILTVSKFLKAHLWGLVSLLGYMGMYSVNYFFKSGTFKLSIWTLTGFFVVHLLLKIILIWHLCLVFTLFSPVSMALVLKCKLLSPACF